MKNLSIFAPPAHFFKRTPYYDYPHLQRGSSIIRAEQIAEYLGAKYNPASGYENDILIYVKPVSFEGLKDGSYVDVVDSIYMAKKMINLPYFGIITCSQSAYDYLKEKKFKNNAVFIPQQHCNFERALRDRKEITTVGVIGSQDSFDYPSIEFSRRMEEKGLKFVTYYSFRNRQEVVNFYKQIDIQVSWNTKTGEFKNPLRIINAASFGIPTIAYPEIGFKEFGENFIAVETIETLVAEVEKLKDEDYYNQWAKKIPAAAEAYHISKIAEKYKQLL